MDEKKHFYGEVLESSFTPSFIVANSWHAKDTLAPQHSHEFGCLHFTTGGLYQEQIEGRDFEVEQGRVLYKPAEIDHSNKFRHVGASTCRIELHLPALRDIQLPDQPLLLSHPNLKKIFNRIRRELRNNDDLTAMAIEGLSWELVCELIRTSRIRDLEPSSAAVRRAHEIIRTDFSSQLSITDLASELGIHRSQLSRSFKSQFGVSLTHFIRQCRIEKSIQLLAENKASLAEIALECGFSDQSHFTRSFRDFMAITPAKWRKGHFE